MGTVTPGRRVDIPDDGYMGLEPGDYGKNSRGQWFVRPPAVNGKYWGVGGIGKHTVVENKDGTITVSPSILVTGHHGATWHGYLTNGVWTEV